MLIASDNAGYSLPVVLFFILILTFNIDLLGNLVKMDNFYEMETNNFYQIQFVGNQWK